MRKLGISNSSVKDLITHAQPSAYNQAGARKTSLHIQHVLQKEQATLNSIRQSSRLNAEVADTASQKKCWTVLQIFLS